MNYYQQGDVIIQPIGTFDVFKKEFENIPDDARTTNSNLVYKGQTNSHALFDGKFDVLESKYGTFIKVIEPTVLDHVKDHNSRERAEHHSLQLPIGDYFVSGVQEYDHVLEESRRVID